MKEFSEKSDVFAFGVTMWEIVQGKRPWAESETLDVAIRVCSGERMALPSSSLTISIAPLIGKCWAHLEGDRPSMQEVFSSVDTTWRDFGGHLEPDPSGGVATLIKGEAFLRPRGQGQRHVTNGGGGQFLASAVELPEEPSFILPVEDGSDEKVETEPGYVDWKPL